MRRRSGDGRSNAGQRLKKSPKRGPDHRLHRRKRIKRETASLSHLGSAGATPLLQYHFNWKTLSAMAGVTWWNFYFRLFPGTIRSPQVVEFLRHLLRHLRCKLLVVWDGLRSHRSALVWDFVRQQKGWLVAGISPRVCPGTEPRG